MPSRHGKTAEKSRVGKPVRRSLPAKLSPDDRLRAALAADDLGPAADAAMEIGPAARDRLPAAIRPAFDAVHAAFALYESGQDEPAREHLQLVGLASPFLEWKVLLRGLIAYAGGDPARALDNWSRLVPARLAAKLIAPVRFSLDQPFRAAQSPETQTALQMRADRLVRGLAPKLRSLQRLLTRPRLADAFRQAETLLKELRQDMPEAVARVAECFRAAVIHHATPENVDLYKRVFGPSADDPKLARLEALAAEEGHAWPSAHEFWQKYQISMVGNPAWPTVDRDRARALVWCRMAKAADEAARIGRRLSPTAEACYKEAIRLAPDLLEPYEQSFLMLREEKKASAALAAGRRLLKMFPDHGPALEAMSDLCRDSGDLQEGLEYARQALAANPLDARLRLNVANGLQGRARALADLGRLAEAAADTAEAVRLLGGRPDVGLLVQAAAIAFKAGTVDAAEAFVGQATALSPASAAYALSIECLRFKLPAPLKERFQGDFTAALAGPPSALAAVGIGRRVSAPRRNSANTWGRRDTRKRSGRSSTRPSRPTPTKPASSACANGSTPSSGVRCSRRRRPAARNDTPATHTSRISKRSFTCSLTESMARRCGKSSRSSTRPAGSPRPPRRTSRFANCSATSASSGGGSIVPGSLADMFDQLFDLHDH